MPGQGVQFIPAFRVPKEWDAGWFQTFIQEVLAKLDARNVIEGSGITVEGTPDTPATISASDDILQLTLQPYIVATPTAFLVNERVLAGESTVVEITDLGPNSTITVGIETGGIDNIKIREGSPTSVIGRSGNTTGTVADILATADGDVLRRAGGLLDFGSILASSVSDFDEAAQDAVGGILQDTATIALTYADATPDITADVVADSIDNTLLADMAQSTIKGRAAGAGTGDPTDLSVTQVNTILSLDSGTYTPTLTNVANLDASTAFQCQYLRVGNTVTVSGRVDVDPTAAAATQLGISLPIPSNFGALEDCGGVAFASGIAGQGAAIRADSANDRAEMVWIAIDLTNQPMYFTFTYQVI